MPPINVTSLIENILLIKISFYFFFFSFQIRGKYNRSGRTRLLNRELNPKMLHHGQNHQLCQFFFSLSIVQLIFYNYKAHVFTSFAWLLIHYWVKALFFFFFKTENTSCLKTASVKHTCHLPEYPINRSLKTGRISKTSVILTQKTTQQGAWCKELKGDVRNSSCYDKGFLNKNLWVILLIVMRDIFRILLYFFFPCTAVEAFKVSTERERERETLTA